MTLARQLFAAILAASLVWTGSAGAAQAHTHEIDEEHGAAFHALASHAHIDHHATAHGHDHHHEHDIAPADVDEGSQSDAGQPDHDKGVFHIHSLCLFALEAQYPSLTHSPEVQVIESPLLVVPFHTRSITPADRPPRTFL